MATGVIRARPYGSAKLTMLKLTKLRGQERMGGGRAGPAMGRRLPPRSGAQQPDDVASETNNCLRTSQAKQAIVSRMSQAKHTLFSRISQAKRAIV